MIFPGKGNVKWMSLSYILVEIFNIKNKESKGWAGGQKHIHIKNQVIIRDKTQIRWDLL